MSAICGLINFDGAQVKPDLLRKMAEAAAHHGPDGIRYWIEGNVGVAHLAFNTTPESQRERQPLLSTDGKLWLVADARVDNRPELIATLSKKGYTLTQAATDADLVLAAYQYWGENCPAHIIGDFAFAIWDKHRQRLFLARDIFGIKPLVYSNTGNVFCFATEAQQILRHPAISWRLDEIAVADFLAANNQEQTHTFFEDIHFVPSAHCLVSRSNNLVTQCYWDFDPSETIVYLQPGDYTAQFRELFHRAVSDRLRTNFPAVGIELSGGLDSSSVAVVADKLLKERNIDRLVAYTLIYDKIKMVDEREYSKIVADALGIDTTYIVNDDIKFISDGSVPMLESPYRWFESRETKILKQLQKEPGQLLLTGAGGDDLVGGSPLVHGDQLRRGDIAALWRIKQDAKSYNQSLLRIIYSWFVRPHLPRFAIRFKRALLGNPPSSLVPPWMEKDFVIRTNIQERLEPLADLHHYHSWAKQAIYQVASQIGNTYRTHFQWMSRIGATHNIEYRHPFLDRRLYEFVVRLPPEQLWHAGFSKYILREALVDLLPEQIRRRPDKTYYSDTVIHSLRVIETKQISQLLEQSITAKLGFVDQSKLKCFLDSYFHNELRQSHTYPLMRLISFEYWLLHHSSHIIHE